MAQGPMGEKIKLLETIRSFAQGAKADLMKAVVKENQLWQAITRYQDLVADDVDTLRDIGDQADDAKKAKRDKETRKKQRLAIENAYSSDGGYIYQPRPRVWPSRRRLAPRRRLRPLFHRTQHLGLYIKRCSRIQNFRHLRASTVTTISPECRLRFLLRRCIS